MSGIDAKAIPLIPRGVRLHEDKVRGLWVLLAPERTINLDHIGLAIVQEIDGHRSIAEVVTRLGEKYEAPVDQIKGDVAEFIKGLTDRRILDLS